MSEHIFTTTVRVLYGDTDAGGVVYNANYLRYFEIGRTELMREWIAPYSEIEKLGFVLPVTESWLRYKAPAVYDDLLTIETTISEVSRIKCKFSCKILREQPGDAKPKLLVKGYTIHAAITKDGKLTRLPSDIQNKLIQYATHSEKVCETAQ
ncbi:acyl-CoA thioesterase [Desulforhopalus sp. 52FAK]